MSDERPDWLTEGATVAIVGGSRRTTVQRVTIERFTKTRVVLDNGDWYPLGRLRKHYGDAWGWDSYLVPLSDPRVAQADQSATEDAAYSRVMRAIDDLRRTRASLSAIALSEAALRYAEVKGGAA